MRYLNDLRAAPTPLLSSYYSQDTTRQTKGKDV